MGKIRVQDLAKMMGISNQDLVFKLKSIGARVEGDDAQIDTDIIQAILQGKKLPHPREVILRDETAGAGAPDRRRMAAAPPPPSTARRPPANPLGSRRPRTLIQKVEPRIQNLPVTERPAPVAVEAAPAVAEALPASAVEAVQPEAVASAAGGAVAAPVVEAPPAHVTEIQAPPPAPAPQMRETPPPPPSRPAAGPSPASARPTGPSPSGGRPGGAPAGRPDSRPGAGPGGRPGGPSGPPRQGYSGGPGARPGMQQQPGRPGPGGQQRPGGPAPGRPGQAMAPALSTEEQKRRAAERMQEQIERDKKKKGTKKPGPRAGVEEDLTSFKGALEDLEEEDLASMSGRRRRRTELRKDEAESGKVLTFKKDKPAGPVMISEGMTLREFAEKLGVRVRDLMGSLFKRGIMANINQVLDPELAQDLARELGVETMIVSFEEEVQLQAEMAGGGAK
ncbi:MAG TPA: translation initiation factor IF-2 N-terminal domain-containing protein, partial [Thermoanaerobaculia bacterium]